MANTPSWSFWPDPNDPNPTDEPQARDFDPVFDPTPAQDMDVFNRRPGLIFGEDPASGTGMPEQDSADPRFVEQARGGITWIDPTFSKPRDWSLPQVDLSFAQAALPGAESVSGPAQAPASGLPDTGDATGFGSWPPSMPSVSQPMPSDTARTIQWEGGPFAPPPDGIGQTVGRWPSAPVETAPAMVPAQDDGPGTWRLAHALFSGMPDALRSWSQADPLAPNPRTALQDPMPSARASSDPFGLLAADWNTGSFAPRFADPRWPSSNPGMQPASPATPVLGDPATRTPSSPTWTTMPQSPMPQMPPAGSAQAGSGGMIPGFNPVPGDLGGVQARPGFPVATESQPGTFNSAGPAAAYGGAPTAPATQSPVVPDGVRAAFHANGTSLFGQPQWVNLLTRIGGRFKNTAVRPALKGQAASGPYAAFWNDALRHVRNLGIGPAGAAAAVADYTLDNAPIAPPGLLSTAQHLHGATQAWFQNRHGIPAGTIPRPQLESLTKSALGLAMRDTGPPAAPFAVASRPSAYAMIKSAYEANGWGRGPQTPGQGNMREVYLAQTTKPVPKPKPKPKPAAGSSSNKYLPAPGSSAYVDGQIVPSYLTTYSPQQEPNDDEGDYRSSFPDLDGIYWVHTLEDYRLGISKYVTIAGDEKYKYNRYTIPKVTYKIGNKVHTIENVPVLVHDKGGAFRGAPEGRHDVPIARDLNHKDRNQGLENTVMIKWWPKNRIESHS